MFETLYLHVGLKLLFVGGTGKGRELPSLQGESGLDPGKSLDRSGRGIAETQVPVVVFEQ